MVKKKLASAPQTQKISSEQANRYFLRNQDLQNRKDGRRKFGKEDKESYEFKSFSDKNIDIKEKYKISSINIDDDLNDDEDEIESQKQINQIHSSSLLVAEDHQSECNYLNKSHQENLLKNQSYQQDNSNKQAKKQLSYYKPHTNHKLIVNHKHIQGTKSKENNVRKQIIKNNKSYLKLLSAKLCQICHQKKKYQQSQAMLCSICDDVYHRTCIPNPLKVSEVRRLQIWVCEQCSKNYFIKEKTIKKITDLDQSEQQFQPCQHLEVDQYPKDFGLYSDAMIMIAYKEHDNKKLTHLSKNFWTQRQYQWFKLQPYKPIKSKVIARQKYWIPLIRVLSQYNLFYCPFQVYKDEEILSLNISKNHLPNIVEMLSVKDEKAFEDFIELVENGQAPPLTLDKCPFKGYLVKSQQKIGAKTIISEYAGEVITYRQSLKSSKNDSIFSLLQTGNSFTTLQIFPKKYANISKYFLGINNSEIQNYNKINVQSILFSYKGRNRIIFYTIREVEKGEILYINYNGGISQDYPTFNFQ